jgi:hypothetical protein
VNVSLWQARPLRWMRKTFYRRAIDWRPVAERRDALLSMVAAIAEMKGDGQNATVW